MGAGSIDLESKRKRIEDLYPYESKGVAAMLDDFYRVEARAYDRADLDSYTVIADLKIALDTDALTPRQRQVVALYYFAELTLEQVAKILDMSAQGAKKILDAAIDRIANEMKNGGASRKGRRVQPLGNSRPLYRWINDVADGAPIYDLPEDVAEDLLHWLSERGDDKAHEVLYQRRHGAPAFVYDTVEHAHIHDRQLWHRYKRELYDDHRNEKEDRFGFYW